jgi:hypothetical protein
VLFVPVLAAKVPWPALSALGLGAIVGALVTQLLSLWREERQNDRERNGFLRLLRNEIESNLRAAHRFETQPKKVWEELFYRRRQVFSTEAWEEVRAQLARLLPDEDFGSIFKCYITIAALQESLRTLPTEDDIPNLPQVIEALSSVEYEGQAYTDKKGNSVYNLELALHRIPLTTEIANLHHQLSIDAEAAKRVVSKYLGSRWWRFSFKTSYAAFL